MSLFASGAVFCLASAALSCEAAYPEVVVVNRIGEHIMLKNPSFNGCVWNTVISYGEATSPGRCLPGTDRVHFQKLDLDVDGGTDAGLINEKPAWYNYQTISLKSVDYGGFWIFEISTDDMEQDFSASGPGGH